MPEGNRVHVLSSMASFGSESGATTGAATATARPLRQGTGTRLLELLKEVPDRASKVVGIVNLNNMHWTTFGLVRARRREGMQDKWTLLYKDSMGGLVPQQLTHDVGQWTVERNNGNGKVDAIVLHTGKEQVHDGNSCGPMSVENLQIMARFLSALGEDGQMAKHDFNLRFARLDRVPELRKKQRKLLDEGNKTFAEDEDRVAQLLTAMNESMEHYRMWLELRMWKDLQCPKLTVETAASRTVAG